MKFSKINIEKKLLSRKERYFRASELLQQVKDILKKDDEKDARIYNELNTTNKNNHFNAFDLDILELDRIYHVSTIKSICIDYRLRFLDSKYFKSPLPYEAISKIKALEKDHHIELKGYRIMAPSRDFKLKNADDPLLFVPITNNYFYLIHKWGNDLHPLRKWLILPFKSIENLAITTLLISLLLTAMIPSGLFSKENSSAEFWILFFFIFKSLAAIIIFYGFALGKNFNSAIWNNEYFNG